MSPEIRNNGKLIADVPDNTGWYRALDGTLLNVDLDLIDVHKKTQIIKITGSSVGGLRVVGLTLEGKGNSDNSRKGGDGKEPTLEVTLRDRPIRVTYAPRVGDPIPVVTPYGGLYIGYMKGEKRTLHNPRWVKGHGQR